MLLVGPPGSGKTFRVLRELEAALARGRAVKLIVPTASMAEHLLHELARRGAGISPRAIQPISDFVESLTPECRELPESIEILLLAQALKSAPAGAFDAVAGYPGFRARLLDTIKEFWAAGYDAKRLRPLLNTDRERSFCQVMLEYENLLRTAGIIHRAQRLRLAAEELRKQKPGAVFFDGFFNFTPAELELVRSAAESADELIITLPDRADDPRAVLKAMGIPETVINRVHRPRPHPVIVQASSPEREIEDVAGRILRTGRDFRDHGLVLRSLETYGPIVGAVFERFGIPFRLYLPRVLAEHGSIRYLRGLLQGLDPVDATVQAPPSHWAERCARLLQESFHAPVLEDEVGHEAILEWRTLAGALRGWTIAAEDAAEALRLQNIEKADLAAYLTALDGVLGATMLRTPDRRRNVVQVLSVYEARQWELPVVFVCGLVEKQFPRYHAQNLFFPDSQRKRLVLSGVRLRTSDELDCEERFLFDLATTRATEQLYLTYPAHDEDGTETLRSFFLEEWDQQTMKAEQVRVREHTPAWRPAPAFLQESDSISALAGLHQRFSPSALENYLQCPFLFFADRTLRLNGPPPAPAERIDELFKGTVIHRTIARWTAQGGGPIGPTFEEVFAEICALENIHLNFRAEVMKAELRADLERFAKYEAARPRPPGFHPAAPETGFEYLVETGEDQPFRVTGRIDRYEVSDGGAVVVVDYKYSRKERLRQICREHEEGARVQAPLYLLGLERQRGLRPAGMLFYGLRKEPSRQGWFAQGMAPSDPDLVRKTPREFREMLEAAASRTLEVVREIRGGRVEVKPRDLQVCREFCRYRDVCRVNLWESGSPHRAGSDAS